MNRNDLINNKVKTILSIIVFVTIPFVTAFVMFGGLEHVGARVIAFLALFLLLVMAGIVFVSAGNNRALFLTVIFLIFITLARCLPGYVYDNKNSKKLIELCENSEHVFSGYIINEDATVSSGMNISINSVDGAILKQPVKAYCYNRSGNFYSEGTYVEISAKIRKPVSSSEMFDFATWLASDGIYCELYNISDVVSDYTKGKFSIGSYLRDKIYTSVFKMLKNIPGKDSFERGNALAKALLIGDKSGFSEEWYDKFSRCGMTHLLCVSGLHFTIMIGGFSVIIRPFVKNRKARKLILLIISVLYLCACGFSKSAMRSAVMAFVGASVLGAESKTMSKLLVAVSVICLIDPMAIKDTSFHLSVLACGGISCSLYLTEMIKNKHNFGTLASVVFDMATMSLGAFAFTVVYTACAFDRISTVSVMTSVLSVLPAQICLIVLWVSVIVGMLNFNPVLFVCAGIYNSLSEYIYGVAKVFSGFGNASLQTSFPDVAFPVFLIMLVAMAFAAFSKARAAKIYFYALIMSVLYITVLHWIS